MAEDIADTIVNRWDSSDPERAPPPLPMNPSSPLTATSRPNTSSAIQNAHAALTEKARESGYITNPPPKRIESPERSLIKGAAHKRMQSLQTGNVRDLTSFMEGGNPLGSVKLSEKSYGRPSTPHSNKDFMLSSPEKDSRFLLESKSPERDSRFLLEDKSPEKHARFANENKSPERTSRLLLEGSLPEKESRFVLNPERDTSRAGTPTPGREILGKDQLTLRPSLRKPPQSILGENAAPQSATMLALQNMATREVPIDIPLADVTNGSSALVRTPQTFDAISNQILSLTSIATSLQRDMAQLSRRSKDNATDLVSLKEATNARDEDIRKSLRELVNGLSESSSRASSNLYGSESRSGGFFLDNKAHNSPGSTSRNIKAFSLPRIPSPNSFAASLDRDSVMMSPGPSYCHDGVTNIALLEKILREMSTREGLDHLGGRIGDLLDLVARDGSSTAKKLDELLELLKEQHSRVMIAQNASGNGGGAGNTRSRNFSFGNGAVLELDFDKQEPGPMTQRVNALISNKENNEPPGGRSAEIINGDVVKLIRTIKDSVAQGGGLTAEVKAMVRDLRGEVLGMGREIGRKLDEANATSAKDLAGDGDEKERVAQVVQDGLEDLKQHMDTILREHRRQSNASNSSKNAIDYQEIFNAVRSAVNEKQERNPDIQKEDILEAVKDAWEAYQPKIEVEQLGLEREEVLACLKEGFQEYCPRESAPSATRDEVFTAVVEGLKHFVPPQIEVGANLSRDEILDAVRECLEEFEFPSAPPAESVESGLTRDDMLDAVKEGLHTFDFSATATALSREVGETLTRDDMLEAVREGLHTFDFPINADSESREIPEGMSRDEMVEAVKEGLKTFDFAAHTAAHTTALVRTGDHDDDLTRGDMLDAVREGLHTFDFPTNINGSDLRREDVLDAINEGLHNFEFPSAVSAVSRNIEDSLTREDVLNAINEGLHNIELPTASTLSRDIADGLSRDSLVDVVKEGLQSFDFAATTSTALTRDIDSVGLSKDDIYDAVKAGLDGIPQLDGFGGEIFKKLEEIMECLQREFLAVAVEAKSNLTAHGRDTEQMLDATKDGFEKLRHEIETYVDRAAEINEKDEILDKMHEGFDALRTEIELLSAQGSNNSLEAVQSELEHMREAMATSLVPHGGGSSADKDEILEVLRTGLEELRSEIDRPRDSNESVLSSSSEILDAIHDGLNSLRSDLERIVNKPVDMTMSNEILDTVKLGHDSIRAEIDKLRESGYSERAIATVSDNAIVPVDSLKRNDIENLEVLIQQLRIKVEAMDSAPPPVPDPAPDAVSKSDLENIEQMLRHVQESVVGISTQERSVDEDGVKRDDIIAIETLLRNTQAKLDDIDPEQAPKKEHLDSVELLVGETKTSINDLSSHLEDVSKRDDVVIVEGLVRDLLHSLEEMKEQVADETRDADKATKSDVESAEKVCLEVKAAIEQMILSDISVLATKEDVKNLEGLVKEFKGRVEHQEMEIYKGLEERKAETVGVAERVSEIKSFLEEFRDALKEKLDHGATSVDALGKLFENISEAIERNANMTSDDLKDVLDTLKTEFEKSNAGVVGSKLESDEKFQQTWDRFESFDTKIDEKFEELLSKYDEAQVSAETKATMDDEKNHEIEAALLGTKAVAEDVKILIDTLGTTLTESVDKMDESGKTVFSRVDETFTRIEETHADAKAEHQLTREQVFKALGGIEGVQSFLSEYNPKILESVKDVLSIVGEHYQHSKSSTVLLQEKIAEIPTEHPPPIELPMIQEAPPAPEKYDDTPVHEKLDKLVDHMQEAGKSFAQLEMLDKIHQQVMSTAAEVSDFVASQTQRIANDHEDKERAVEAATLDLEKKLAQKEFLESSVGSLRKEEEQLRDSVATLKAEQDDLTHQKMRLSAEVSSIETAIRIRREELHAMEARAEGLERRILEGVIDHSRALLLSKSKQSQDPMSRKRVPSHTNSVAGSIISNATSKASTTHSAVSMAMNSNTNRAVAMNPIKNSVGAVAQRRILSLNQITHNVPTGNFKRSHSVKTNPGAGALRKSSWGGTLCHKYGELNKENLALKESEEDDDIDRHSDRDDVSESGTLRRSSRGTTILTQSGTGTGMSDSVIDEGTEWTGSSLSEDYTEGSDDEHMDETVTDLTAPDEGGMVLYKQAQGEVA